MILDISWPDLVPGAKAFVVRSGFAGFGTVF